MNLANSTHGTYPIRTVSTLTGVNSITLRAWEKRYGLINPTRSQSGHRLYSRDDINLIRKVTELLNEGISISQVISHLGNMAKPQTHSIWDSLQQQIVDSISSFNTHQLENAYSEALSLFPVEQSNQRLFQPLLEQLKEKREFTAQTRFFNNFIRNKLGARFHHASLRTQGPRIVAACLPGEHHDLDLLFFCSAAVNRGLQIILLGADVTIADTALSAKIAAADAILLSGLTSLAPTKLQFQLTQLITHTKIPVFVTGDSAVQHFDAIHHAGASSLGDDIGQSIEQIHKILGK